MSAVHMLALAPLLIVSAGAVVTRSTAVDSKGEFFAYDYSKHGQDWQAGNCASRSRQSPINLPSNVVPNGDTFSYKYNPIVTPVEMMNNGHALSIDLGGEGYGGITYENAWYNLMNINVHSLSEHKWAGLQQPIELHMVHQRADGEALLIVAVPVDSPMLTGLAMAADAAAKKAQAAAANGFAAGFLQANKSSQGAFPALFPRAAGVTYAAPLPTDPMFNPALQAFLQMPPPPTNYKVRVHADSAHAFDFNALMQGGNFYEYAGSLTAPPCSEIATWLVREQPIKASDLQVMYLHDAVYKTTADYGNFRSLMPLNGRIVNLRKGIFEDKVPTAAPAVIIPNVPHQSDREYHAMKWAQDAMTIANHATAYVRDLDSRLRSAAEGHAAALAPQLEPLMVNGQVITPGQSAESIAAMSNGAVPTLPPLKEGEGRMVMVNGVSTWVVGAAPQQTPEQLQFTAEKMARTLAAAAREEIEEATQEIHAKAVAVAKKSAYEAANMVLKGEPLAMPAAA